MRSLNAYISFACLLKMTMTCPHDMHLKLVACQLDMLKLVICLLYIIIIYLTSLQDLKIILTCTKHMYYKISRLQNAISQIKYPLIGFTHHHGHTEFLLSMIAVNIPIKQFPCSRNVMISSKVTLATICMKYT